MIALSILIYAALGFCAAAQDFSKVIDDADKAVGRVLNFAGEDLQGTGSGFIFGRANGRILLLTNEHVIEGGNEFFVGFKIGETRRIYSARVINSSKIVDLAVLELEPSDNGFHQHRPLSIATGKQGKSIHVAAVGYPGLSEVATSGGIEDPSFFENTVTTGTISRVSQGNFGDGGSFEIVQHTAPINPGNSGGPLINQCAAVVGVNTQGPLLKEGGRVVPQGTFWSSSNQTVSAFLQQAGVNFSSAPDTCTPGRQGAPETVERDAPEVDPAPNQSPTDDSDIRQIYMVAALLGVLALFVGLFIFAFKKKEVPGGVLGKPTTSIERVGTPQIALKIGTAKMTLTDAILARGVILGRDADCDLQVDHKDISRRHARLSVQDRKLMIEDLSSSNGTTVSGKKLKPGSPRQINTSSDVALAKIPLVLVKF